MLLRPPSLILSGATFLGLGFGGGLDEDFDFLRALGPEKTKTFKEMCSKIYTVCKHSTHFFTPMVNHLCPLWSWLFGVEVLGLPEVQQVSELWREQL